MFGTPAAAASIWKRQLANKCFVIKVTNHCSQRCEHCSQSSSPGRKDLVNLDDIKKCLEPYQNLDWEVTLQGGEPLERPEKCKEIMDWLRPRGFQTIIVSSGFWGKDPKMIDFMINELAPNELQISWNKWTQKAVPFETTLPIIEALEHCKHINLWGGCAWGSKEILTGDNWGLQHFLKDAPYMNAVPKGLQDAFQCLPLQASGRGYKLWDEVPRKKVVNELMTCDTGGVCLEPNGDLRVNNLCTRCMVGNIHDKDFVNIATTVRRRIHKPKIRVTGTIGHISEICTKYGINCNTTDWSEKEHNIILEN